MKTGILTLLLISLPMVLPAEAVTDALWLWFDNENTYYCDDPFLEEGLTAQLVATTAEDCDGGGNCNFGWSEGVIYMHPVRLEVDLSPLAAVDSVQVYYWGPVAEDFRVFLYNGEDLVASQFADWYGDWITVRTGGQAVDRLAISACESELYEVAVFAGDGTSAVNLGGAGILNRPYPNPANPRCRISFSLPSPTDGVRLDIHDARGRLMRRLVDGEFLAEGEHERVWNGMDDHGRVAPSGVYFARLRTGEGVMQRRLTLVR